MGTKTLKSNNLFSGNPRWSPKQCHELRIYLRRSKVLLKLSRKEFAGKTERRPSKKLLETLNEFLSDCSPVRDCDAMLVTLKTQGWITSQRIKNVQNLRKAKLDTLKARWPLQRRIKLFGTIETYKKIEQHEVSKKRRRKVIQKWIRQLLKKALTKEPTSKENWHLFRRSLRKINYLKHLLHQNNPRYLELQKVLGRLHDFEILAHNLQLQAITLNQEQVLVARAQDFFLEMQSNAQTQRKQW